jgi:hypothetical protein
VIESILVKKRCLLLGLALAATPAVAQNTIGEVFSSDASVRGSVVLAGNGTHVVSGSQVTAGDGAAVLKLERGGNVRICPQTNLSLSADASGKALVLGLNAGSMELDYTLSSAADSLITPDFRMQLISPGTFHLAISVAPTGDTCVRTLPGNEAAVFVTEMVSNESYQLSPGKHVLFRAGKIRNAAEAPAVCGCPEMKAEAPAASAAAQESTVASATPSVGTSTPAPTETKGMAETHAAAHLEVESSFVYRGNEAAQDYYATVARLSSSTNNSQLALALLPRVSAPSASPKAAEKKESALHRIGRFFGRLFGK